MRKILLGALIILLIVFVAFSVVPYLIYIPGYEFDPENKPYPESKYINVGDVHIHYREWLEVDEGEFVNGKVLFVHGFYGSTFSFDKNYQNLVQRGFHVISIDLPGYGFSSKYLESDYSRDGMAYIVSDFMDNIDNQNNRSGNLPWNLIGHSMGAGIILKVAENKTNIGSLILISPSLQNQNNAISYFTFYPPVKRWVSVLAQYYYFRYNRVSGLLESAYGRRASDEEIRAYLEPMELPGSALVAGEIVDYRGGGEIYFLKKKFPHNNTLWIKRYLGTRKLNSRSEFQIKIFKNPNY
jgi:alpha-beta hydrolase superfamily lysophospholipase